MSEWNRVIEFIAGVTQASEDVIRENRELREALTHEQQRRGALEDAKEIPDVLVALWGKLMNKTPHQLAEAATLIRMSLPDGWANWDDSNPHKDMLEIVYSVSKVLEWKEQLAKEALTPQPTTPQAAEGEE